MSRTVLLGKVEGQVSEFYSGERDGDTFGDDWTG
jgi:hypothetical protein